MSREDVIIDQQDVPQLHLDLPALPGPHFWELQVGERSLCLYIKKRTWFWPFKCGHIESTANAYIFHYGRLDQDDLDQLSEKGLKMSNQVNPAQDVIKQLKSVKFNVPVRVVKQ